MVDKWAAGNFIKKKYTIYFKSLVKILGWMGLVWIVSNFELNQKSLSLKILKLKKIKIEEDINAKIDIAKYLRLILLLIETLFCYQKVFLWFGNLHLIFRLFNKIYFSNQKKAGN